MALSVCQCCKGGLEGVGHTLHLAFETLSSANLQRTGLETEVWGPGNSRTQYCNIASVFPPAHIRSTEFTDVFGGGISRPERPYLGHTNVRHSSLVSYRPQVRGFISEVLGVSGTPVNANAADVLASQAIADGVNVSVPVHNGGQVSTLEFSQLVGKSFGFRSWAVAPTPRFLPPVTTVSRRVRNRGRYHPFNVLSPAANPFNHIHGNWTILNYSVLGNFLNDLVGVRWGVKFPNSTFQDVELDNPGNVQTLTNLRFPYQGDLAASVRTSIATASLGLGAALILDYGSPFPTIEFRRFGMQQFYRPSSLWGGQTMRFVPDGVFFTDPVTFGVFTFQYMPEGLWHHRSGYAGGSPLYSGAWFSLPPNHLPQHIDLVRI